MIQNFEEFLNESLKKEFVQFTLDDLQEYNIWVPNDDITKTEAHDIAVNFYKKYPANYNDCGTILGIDVRCEYKNPTLVKFTIFYGNADIKQKIDVIKEIVNFLTETVYSVAGNDKDIEKMLKSI